MANVLRMLVISIAALTASCSDFHATEAEGGETHFLMDCAEDACPSELSCVCGVCTTTCANDTACSALGGRAACEGTKLASFACGDEVPPAQVCDATCSNDTQCEAHGDGYECIHGRCRPEAIAKAVAMDDECEDGGCEDGTDPLVLIVLDTSLSMERKADCECTSPACSECLPECSSDGSEKNRWAQTLEALTGTFDDFSCEAIDRETLVDTHDSNANVPHHEPRGVQRADGILQTFATRVRFGIATMDAIASYDRDQQRDILEYSFTAAADEAGLWSYPPAQDPSEVESRVGDRLAGSYRYPGCPQPYFMNTGIRNRDAAAGALIVETALDDESATEEAIRQTLLAVRPFGGTPIAAALDDVRALFELDPSMSAERDNPQRAHVLLITDGRPDGDYRANNCDCNEPESGKDGCAGLLREDESPSDMHCPYPTPERAALALRCGNSAACDTGFVSKLHVIGFAVSGDEIAREKVDAIAFAGDTERGAFANNGDELRAAIAAILDGIVE
jgi:hypothetical protein